MEQRENYTRSALLSIVSFLLKNKCIDFTRYSFWENQAQKQSKFMLLFCPSHHKPKDTLISTKLI